jgi:hypothetical protein
MVIKASMVEIWVGVLNMALRKFLPQLPGTMFWFILAYAWQLS